MDANGHDQNGEHQPAKSPSPQPNGHDDQDQDLFTHFENQPSTNAQPIERSTSQSNADSATQPDTMQLSAANANSSAENQIPPSGQDSTKSDEVPIDPKEALDSFGWKDLERRFVNMMEECEKQEVEIQREFAEWCRLFQAWASTTREYEEERLHKRLKTRMAWVQNSEAALEDKRLH
ncbi:MAG: hypothetical protein Q9200_007319, partial [Gallowayella weberi]